MYEDAILTNDHRAHNATTVQTQADWNRWEGVLREAYLASRMRQHGLTYSIQRFTLHASRMTSDEECNSGSAIAAEVFMNHAG